MVGRGGNAVRVMTASGALISLDSRVTGSWRSAPVSREALLVECLLGVRVPLTAVVEGFGPAWCQVLAVAVGSLTVVEGHEVNGSGVVAGRVPLIS